MRKFIVVFASVLSFSSVASADFKILSARQMVNAEPGAPESVNSTTIVVEAVSNGCLTSKNFKLEVVRKDGVESVTVSGEEDMCDGRPRMVILELTTHQVRTIADQMALPIYKKYRAPMAVAVTRAL